jgi:hypothetical protein
LSALAGLVGLVQERANDIPGGRREDEVLGEAPGVPDDQDETVVVRGDQYPAALPTQRVQQREDVVWSLAYVQAAPEITRVKGARKRLPIDPDDRDAGPGE